MLLGQKILLLTILSCIKYSQCHAKLTKLSKNRFVMPGRSCGVLNSIKILHEFPKNDEEIKPCTILDLNENHRKATTTTTITATTITTQTTTTTIPTTTTQTIAKTIPTATRVTSLEQLSLAEFGGE